MDPTPLPPGSERLRLELDILTSELQAKALSGPPAAKPADPAPPLPDPQDPPVASPPPIPLDPI